MFVRRLFLLALLWGWVGSVSAGDVVEHAPVLGPDAPSVLSSRKELVRVGVRSALDAGGRAVGEAAKGAGDFLKHRVTTRRNQVRGLLGMKLITKPVAPDPTLSHLTEDQRAAIARIKQQSALTHHLAEDVTPADIASDQQLQETLENRVVSLLINKKNYKQQVLPNLIAELKVLLDALQRLHDRTQAATFEPDTFDVEGLRTDLGVMERLGTAEKLYGLLTKGKHDIANLRSAALLGDVQRGLFFSFPELPEFQQAVNRLAYGLYKKIFVPAFTKGSFEQKTAIAFMKLYDAYLKNPIQETLSAARTMYQEGPQTARPKNSGDFINPVYDVIHHEDGSTELVLKKQPSSLPDEQVDGVLRTVSEIMKTVPLTAEVLDQARTEVEKLTYNTAVYNELVSAFERVLPPSLDSLQLFVKGVKAGDTSFNMTISRLNDTVEALQRLGNIPTVSDEDRATLAKLHMAEQALGQNLRTAQGSIQEALTTLGQSDSERTQETASGLQDTMNRLFSDADKKLKNNDPVGAIRMFTSSSIMSHQLQWLTEAVGDNAQLSSQLEKIKEAIRDLGNQKDAFVQQTPSLVAIQQRSKLQQTVMQQMEAFGSSTQAGVKELEQFLKKAGVASFLAPELGRLSTGVDTAIFEAQQAARKDPLQAAQGLIKALAQLRIGFERAYAAKMQGPDSELAIKKYRVQGVIESELAALQAKEAAAQSAALASPKQGISGKGSKQGTAATAAAPFHSDTGTPTIPEKPELSEEDAAKLAAVDEQLSPIKEGYAHVKAQMVKFQQLLETKLFDDTAFEAVLAQYKQLQTDVSALPLESQKLLGLARTTYKQDLVVAPVIENYASMVSYMTHSLVPYQGLLFKLMSVREVFDTAQSILMRASKGPQQATSVWRTAESLRTLSQFSAGSFENITQFVDTKAVSLLRELGDTGLDLEKPAPLPVTASRPRPALTQEQVEKAGKTLERIETMVDGISVSRRMERITTTLSQKPLRVDDLKSAYTLYNTFQKEVPEQFAGYKQQVDAVWSGNAAAGAGEFFDQIRAQISQQEAIRKQLAKLRADYEVGLKQLKAYNLEAVPEILQAFNDADVATSSIPRIESAPAESGLRARVSSLLGWSKPAAQPVPSGPAVNLDTLGGLFFWQSGASEMEEMVRGVTETFLQDAVLKAPVRYKNAGLMLDYGRELLGMEKVVGKLLGVWSGQKEVEIETAQAALTKLEQLEVKTERITPPLPKTFMEPFLKRLRIQKSKLQSALLAPEDLLTQLTTWQQTFVTGFADEVKDSASLPTVKKGLGKLIGQIEQNIILLKRYPLDRMSDQSFAQAVAQVSQEVDRMRVFLNASPVWDVIPELGQAEFALRNLEAAKSTVARAQTWGVGRDLNLNFSASEYELTKLLFFKDATFPAIQATVKARALQDLEEALRAPEVLTPEQMTYDRMIVDDYKQLQMYHQQVQQVLQTGTAEDIQALQQGLQSFYDGLISRYHNQGFPDHVVDYKNHVLDEVREDQAALAGRVRELQQVVPEPVVEHHDEPVPSGAASSGDGGSFVTAQEVAEQELEQFKEALPVEMQALVEKARVSFATMKTVAGKLVDNPNTIDSIGLAEQLLRAVETYEQALPLMVQENSTLASEIADLKILLKYVINRQKMTVVTSLQGAYESFRSSWGTAVYPKATSAFVARAQELLTPHKGENVQGSTSNEFLQNAQMALSKSAKNSKGFFDVLQAEQEKLQGEFDAGQYATEFSRMKNDPESGIGQAFADHEGGVLQSAIAAVDIQLARLEKSYMVAVFDTLTSDQQAAFKAHNESLYFALRAQDLKDRATAYIFAIHANLSLDSSTITRAKLGQYVHEVHQYRAMCEGLYSELKVAQSVNGAFKAYDLLAPLYARLSDIEQAFELVRKDKVTDAISFWKRLSVYFDPYYHPDYGFPIIHLSDSNQQFLRRPAYYLQSQIVPTQRGIRGAQERASDLETRTQELLRQVQKGRMTTYDVSFELANLGDELKQIRAVSDPYETIYKTYNVIISTNPALGREALRAFEKGSNGAPLSNEQVLTFMAQVLSVPGSLFIPPSGIIDTPREELLARLVATGKTRDTEVNGQLVKADPRYRDLMFVLDNPLAWDLERMKLEGRSVPIDYKELQKGYEQILATYPQYTVTSTLGNIEGLLVKIQKAAAQNEAAQAALAGETSV